MGFEEEWRSKELGRKSGVGRRKGTIERDVVLAGQLARHLERLHPIDNRIRGKRLGWRSCT